MIGNHEAGLSLTNDIQCFVAQRAPAFSRPAGRENDTQESRKYHAAAG
jgi:hypothetical protein